MFENYLEDEERTIQEIEWKKNMRSFKTLVETFKNLPMTTLKLTKEVLLNREKLELQTVELQKDERKLKFKREELKKLFYQIEALEESKNFTKDFKFEHKDLTTKRVNLPVGIHTTTCITCSRTCHADCAYANDADKKRCVAMDINGKCTVCKSKCVWSDHANLPYKYEEEVITI